MPANRRTRIGLRTVVLGYLGLLLAFPVAFVFYRTFENGLGAIWDALTTPNAIHAIELTLIRVSSRAWMALGVVSGRQGWFGSWFLDQGIQIIFSTPGMILATVFVSLPFVVREVIPVLREIGTTQEEAA